MWPFLNRKNLFLASLKEGEIFETKVEELIEGGEAIINFRGNLLRVQNQAALRPGDRIKVRVVSIRPDLIFEVVHAVKKIDPGKSRFEVQC